MAEIIEDVIEGEHVRFTPLKIENIYQHFEWNNDPELNRFDSDVPFSEETLGDFKARFEQMVFDPLPGSRDFEIHLNEGKLIGVAYIAAISESNRHCKIGVTIGDRSCWRKGYGVESLRLLLDYCFNDMQMHRVTAETFEYNTAWRNLVEDMGFSHEGTEREYLFRDGQFWDNEIYGLLEQEYRKIEHEAPSRQKVA
jgi:RimJ/RimL family protein N-acetyltransferase